MSKVAYPEVLSEPFVVVVRKIVVADELQGAVEIHAEVGDGPSYHTVSETLLEAIGQLATAAAADAAQDEAIAWEEHVRGELTEWSRCLDDDSRVALRSVLDDIFRQRKT